MRSARLFLSFDPRQPHPLHFFTVLLHSKNSVKTKKSTHILKKNRSFQKKIGENNKKTCLIQPSFFKEKSRF
ncbi:hypothetical protein EVA_11342 [gut metagenome]|uniref:Uncharacterized protein n=1 Tax=gut metagenome TaxID=749906 RepID=J9G161_9ZZZZ